MRANGPEFKVINFDQACRYTLAQKPVLNDYANVLFYVWLNTHSLSSYKKQKYDELEVLQNLPQHVQAQSDIYKKEQETGLAVNTTEVVQFVSFTESTEVYGMFK